MWPFSQKKPLFSKEENDLIVHSIQDAEKQTSGEIRVFAESRCKYVDALDRAAEIFLKLKMDQTELHNGVLFYIAIKDRQLAIFADSAIHGSTGENHWKNVVKQILSVIHKEDVVSGIVTSITAIGEALKTHFPYNKEVDKNELPDEIVFGN